MIIFAFIGIIIVIYWLLFWVFPIKCPKCNKKCIPNYYIPGIEDSFYYECPEHGDINELNQQAS